jgi:hypothetical protein
MEKTSLGPRDYRKIEIRLLKGFKIGLAVILLMIIFTIIRHVAPAYYIGSSGGITFSIYTFVPLIIHGYLLFQYCL